MRGNFSNKIKVRRSRRLSGKFPCRYRINFKWICLLFCFSHSLTCHWGLIWIIIFWKKLNWTAHSILWQRKFTIGSLLCGAGVGTGVARRCRLNCVRRAAPQGPKKWTWFHLNFLHSSWFSEKNVEACEFGWNLFNRFDQLKNRSDDHLLVVKVP